MFSRRRRGVEAAAAFAAVLTGLMWFDSLRYQAAAKVFYELEPQMLVTRDAMASDRIFLAKCAAEKYTGHGTALWHACAVSAMRDLRSAHGAARMLPDLRVWLTANPSDQALLTPLPAVLLRARVDLARLERIGSAMDAVESERQRSWWISFVTPSWPAWRLDPSAEEIRQQLDRFEREFLPASLTPAGKVPPAGAGRALR